MANPHAAWHRYGSEPFPEAYENDWTQANLFDIITDPGETNNLAAQFPEVVSALRTKLITMSKQRTPEQLQKISNAVTPKNGQTKFVWLNEDNTPKSTTPVLNK
eukprot:TRINITY_DN85562_c0_g1_i1.p1 TRINITY_DN85562_c0_g1~~TRINITY_DN85562_c0_g1_i1.p1  ORF type:complete len:120 (-),score=6.35 TRINITY_DN85562_c0_g1_i1:41-352(-)